MTSPPPWNAYAPRSPVDFLWSELREFRGQYDADLQEVHSRLGKVEASAARQENRWHIAKATARFLWNDGGKILWWVGGLAFALTGITGQLPSALNETAQIIRSLGKP